MTLDPEELASQISLENSQSPLPEELPTDILQESFYDLALEIWKRCKTAKIKTLPENFGEDDHRLIMQFPIGRESQNIYIRGIKNTRFLLSTNFEEYVGITDYRAIVSFKDNLIEAAISSNISSVTLLKALGINTDSNVYNGSTSLERLTIENDKNIEISIGLASNTFYALEILSQNVSFFRSEFEISNKKSRLINTIIIKGPQIHNGEHAKELLEAIANSLCFQIECLFNIPLSVSTRNTRQIRPHKSVIKDDNAKLTFPKYQYDTKPMSLYWYASTAEKMPLLQYLAYYQAIEYYFSQFSEQEAHEIIKRKLKDPSFESRLDENISRLLDSLKPFIGKSGYGDERHQLLATVKNCVTPEELHSFFAETEERLDFFKNKWKAIVQKKIQIPTENSNSDKGDIIGETVSRIYEIRCKIVHTKQAENGRQDELLLPYSKEAQQLDHDIDLIHFIARKVLIASARPLSLK